MFLCMYIYRELTLGLKVLCVGHYSYIECTCILSCHFHNHHWRKNSSKQQILKENVDLVVEAMCGIGTSL